MMEKEFVNYNQALKLKELGFDEPCFGFYQIEYGEIRPIMVDDDEQYRLTGYRTCKNSEIPKNYTSAPTFSQAFRWFREKHNLFGKVYITNFGGDEYSFNVYDLYEEEYKYENFIGASMSYAGTFEAYEEAELACLDKLIEIVENEKTL